MTVRDARSGPPERRTLPKPIGVTDRISGILGLFTAPKGHTPWLDGWRGLCILMVMLGHFAPRLLGHLAPLGVEMFFVLSGQLMAEMLIVRRERLATFIVHRASRILPLLAFYTGVITIGLAAASLTGTRINWLSPFASVLLFSNYLADPEPLLEHTWSLAVEGHSYLLLAFVAGISARKPAVAAWIAFALALGMIINGFVLFYGRIEPAIYVLWRSDVRGASVVFSFALSLSLRDWQPQGAGRWWSWLSPACLVGAALCMIPADPMTLPQMTACTILAALSVNTIQFSSVRYRQFLSRRALTILGALSFSLYIWQQPFFMASKRDLPAVLAAALTVVCAMWSFVRIETPARRFLNRRWAEARINARFAGASSAHVPSHFVQG
jgi:peptidoglycan/LPS O-acetylase OafA/YrhL